MTRVLYGHDRRRRTMYERTNYLAVGVFILIGALVLLAVGFWVGDVSRTVPMSQYTIIFERDVNGLSEGSPVRYMGVDVGEVTTIRLFHAQNTAIEVQIEIDSSTPVNSGTYARLGYQGITGVAFINLAEDAGEQEEITVTAGHDYPVIPTRDVGIAALLNSGPEVMDRLHRMLDDISMLLSEKNLSATSQILQNVEQLTGALAGQRHAMAGLPVRMHESLDQLHKTLQSASEITEEGKPDLLLAAQHLRHSTENLANVSERVESWVVENDAAVNSFLAGGVGETAALVSDTREAMRELEKLGAELRSNPSRVIYKPKLAPVTVAQ
ncbi:MAG: MCE family protein [Gammaproteobacteria bacterium]|nr:MCE family protein [Gammaproteobacteria bacterium]